MSVTSLGHVGVIEADAPEAGAFNCSVGWAWLRLADLRRRLHPSGRPEDHESPDQPTLEPVNAIGRGCTAPASAVPTADRSLMINVCLTGLIGRTGRVVAEALVTDPRVHVDLWRPHGPPPGNGWQ
ncbi:hypothetical protein ACSMXN_22020 [Jatrophihabitans sp. DSM 45814]